ncbi:MAG: hypothetical protein ACYDC5_11630 [Candidatus Dormibacteria bacterium]
MSRADSFFHNQDHDPWLFAHIVRWRATKWLANNVPVRDWKLVTLPMSGIEIHRGPYRARVLSHRAGSPPHPGSSQARREFWGQLNLPLDTSGTEPPLSANLILGWSLAAGRLIHMTVTMPSGPWEFKRPANVAWEVDVVFPSQTELRFQPRDEEAEPLEFESDASPRESDFAQ